MGIALAVGSFGDPVQAAPVVSPTALPEPYPLLGQEGVQVLQFGMHVADVRKLRPGLKALQRPLGAVAPSLPTIARYVLSGESVPEHAKSSDIELRFWDDTLWAIIVYFPAEEAEAVGAALRARYGPPTGGSHAATIWRGSAVTLVLVPQQHWYGFTDNQLNQAVENEIAGEVSRAVARQRTSAATTPTVPAPESSRTAPATFVRGVQ